MTRSCALGILLLGLLLPSVPASSSAGASLADAAQLADWSRVDELLEASGEAKGRQADGMTALHWAVYHDHLETAAALVAAGAEVDAVNRYGLMPLSLASTNGGGAMVELLLEAGADPNSSVAGGETVLMTAVRTGRTAAVEALIAAGSDVNRPERSGQTALMWAAAEGHAAVVEILLHADADPTVTLDSGFSAFLFAVREGRIEVARLLLAAGADPDQTIKPRRRVRRAPRPGTSALVLALNNGHFDLASALLDAGADANADLPGFTPLHAIASVRKPGIGDNDPPPQGSGSMTSLELVRRLVAHGAELDAPMTKAVNLGNTRLNKIGATPFFLAAQSADAALMRLLAELGADPLIPNEENSSPLMAAAGLGTRSPGEDAGTESEVLEAVEVALDLGADVNGVDDHGETAMHAASYKNLPKVVEFLAEHGADIGVWNRKNEFGWTPLAIAEGYRFGNFKPSPVTIAALHKVMIAAGVEPTLGEDPVTTQQIY